MRASLESQLQELREQLAEYEASHGQQLAEVAGTLPMPSVLVEDMPRIAKEEQARRHMPEHR